MKNVNADFLLDIWADLKAKKLAPVAVGLAVALVAMPALMLKGEDAPSSSPLPIAATPAASGDGAEVELAEELGDGGSKLDSYKAHDPFSGGAKADDGSSSTSGTAIAPGDAAAPDTGGDLAKLLGGGGGPPGGSPPGGGLPSAPGFGQQPDSGSGGGLTTGSDVPQVRRTNFTYELDVKFGRPGNEKRYRHLTRMSFLPSAKVPALLFMGVPVDAKSAIFFVHPSLSHQGEGKCSPSETNCNFIELAVGRDEFLAVNDYEFRLHLYGVHRVKLDEQATQQRQTTGSSRSDRGVGEGTLGRGDRAGGYDLPAIADGIG
jgi:hypothetical protein